MPIEIINAVRAAGAVLLRCGIFLIHIIVRSSSSLYWQIHDWYTSISKNNFPQNDPQMIGATAQSKPRRRGRSQSQRQHATVSETASGSTALVSTPNGAEIAQLERAERLKDLRDLKDKYYLDSAKNVLAERSIYSIEWQREQSQHLRPERPETERKVCIGRMTGEACLKTGTIPSRTPSWSERKHGSDALLSEASQSWTRDGSCEDHIRADGRMAA